METNAHRLDEGAGAGIEITSGNHLLPRQSDELAHGTVTLYTQCLVMLTGVYALVTARGALAAVSVRIAGYHHAGLQVFGHVGTHLFNHGTHLVARYNGHFYHGVLTQPCAQVGTTKTYILEAQQHLVGLHFLLRNVYYFHLALARNLYCFHWII